MKGVCTCKTNKTRTALSSKRSAMSPMRFIFISVKPAGKISTIRCYGLSKMTSQKARKRVNQDEVFCSVDMGFYRRKPVLAPGRAHSRFAACRKRVSGSHTPREGVKKPTIISKFAHAQLHYTTTKGGIQCPKNIS